VLSAEAGKRLDIWVCGCGAWFFREAKRRCRPRGRALCSASGLVCWLLRPAGPISFGETATGSWCRWAFLSGLVCVATAALFHGATGTTTAGCRREFATPPGGAPGCQLALGAWRCCCFLPTLEYAPLHRRSDFPGNGVIPWREYLRSQQSSGLPSATEEGRRRARWWVFACRSCWGPLCEGRWGVSGFISGWACGRRFSALAGPCSSPVFCSLVADEKKCFNFVPAFRGLAGAGLF